MNWMRISIAALLVVGVSGQGRGAKTRCRGSGRRDLGAEYDFEKYLNPESAHRNLHFGQDGFPLCIDPEAIETCYIFLYDPEKCDKNDECSNLCGGICSEFLDPANGCLVEPCFGIGCNFDVNPPNAADFAAGSSCAAIAGCYNGNAEDCAKDFCSEADGFGPDDPVCLYIEQNEWGPTDDYIIPCPCVLPGIYEPSKKDRLWPGKYPGGNPNSANPVLTINTRTDGYPTEIFWLLRKLNANGVDWDFISGGTFSYSAADKVVSNDFQVEPNSMYEIIYTDTWGDGFYTDLYGFGWFSITQGANPGDPGCTDYWPDRPECGVVLTLIAEYEGQMKVYINVDANGFATYQPNYVGNEDDFTSQQNQGNSCWDVGCFDSSTDPQWPGVIAPAGHVTLNIKTDDYPEETSAKLWKLHADEFDFEIVAEIPEGSLWEYYNTLLSYNYSVETETIYKLQLNDPFGDGVCCGYGYGWITLTAPDGEVLWDIGQNFLEEEFIFYIGSTGDVSPADYVEGKGYGAFTLVVPEPDHDDDHDHDDPNVDHTHEEFAMTSQQLKPSPGFRPPLNLGIVYNDLPPASGEYAPAGNGRRKLNNKEKREL